MGDDDGGWHWHDQRGVTWAAGAAAVALIVLLVWAVVQTATDSSTLPDLAPSGTSAVTSATRKTVTPSTSYPLPSVQTSEINPVPAPTGEPSPEDPTTTSTSTMTTNPYVTTTTQNGGAV